MEKKKVNNGNMTSLSVKEREILCRIASGMKYPDIAEQLFLSKHTVKRHMQNIYERTAAQTLAHATALAVVEGVIRQSETDPTTFVMVVP